jgi:hypothetical protein
MLDKAALIARDLCEGAEEIGVFLDKTKRQAVYLCATRQVPAYKFHGRWNMRPSRYYRHIAELEDRNVAPLSEDASVSASAA